VYVRNGDQRFEALLIGEALTRLDPAPTHPERVLDGNQ
jgi:hypothetical protein